MIKKHKWVTAPKQLVLKNTPFRNSGRTPLVRTKKR